MGGSCIQPHESTYPDDWLQLAERDLLRVEWCLAAADPALAGFCLQQAVEKFLKAYLLRRGWSLRRIHDLEVLLNDALPHDQTLEAFRAACQIISGYYTLERYPLAGGGATTDADVRASLTAILPLVERLRGPAASSA
jgi:HEPN domain-containing protein